jgi:hypothetical protein
VWFVGSQIDELARRAIEAGGTYALGVETTVEKVGLALFAGTCEIENVNVANVPGYQDPTFMVMRHGEVAVDLKSLQQQQKVTVPYLRLNGIDVYVERKDGVANLDVLLDYIDQRRSGSTDTQEPTEPGTEIGYVINELVIDNVTVHVTTDLVGGTSNDIALPTIKMTDVGSDTDYGAQMAQITDIIVRAILATLVKKGGGILPDALLSGMEDKLEAIGPLKDLGIETIGDLSGAAQDIVGSLADPNKSAEEKVQDVTGTVSDTVEKTGKRANTILEGLGGALGGDKKDE